MQITMSGYLFYSMVSILFLLGLSAILSGVGLLMTKELREAVKKLSSHSTILMASPSMITGKAISDSALVPVMDAASRLIESVSNLIRTSAGVGAFLCLLGFVMDVGAVYLLMTFK